MEGINQEVSANTLSRFVKSHRKELLPSYLKFKHQHQVLI